MPKPSATKKPRLNRAAATLANISNNISRRAKWHRHNMNDPHCISNAVAVSLTEISEAIEETLKHHP